MRQRRCASVRFAKLRRSVSTLTNLGQTVKGSDRTDFSFQQMDSQFFFTQ
jgi:hypothetical protein